MKEKKTLCVYVAGPYSSSNALQVFDNMRTGMLISVEVFRWGFAPFCPWLDYHFCLMNNQLKFTVEDFYNYSMAWMEKADAVLLCGDWRNSKGAMAEVDRAYELGIPVFGHLSALIQWAEDPKSLADGVKPSHKKSGGE